MEAALDVACSALATFTAAFDTPYALEKLDIAGLPSYYPTVSN